MSAKENLGFHAHLFEVDPTICYTWKKEFHATQRRF